MVKLVSGHKSNELRKDEAVGLMIKRKEITVLYLLE
jgi:hypothetical protein